MMADVLDQDDPGSSIFPNVLDRPPSSDDLDNVKALPSTASTASSLPEVTFLSDSRGGGFIPKERVRPVPAPEDPLCRGTFPMPDFGKFFNSSWIRD